MKLKNLLWLIVISFIACSCATSRNTSDTEYYKIDASYGYKGILEERFHECSAPGPSTRRMYVYLPADYYESDTRYPVFYLLHGARGNETSWIIKGNLLHQVDSLMACGKMEKTIIVLPNTNQHKDDKDYNKSRIKGAVEALFEVDGCVESAFVDDVVTTIDSLYRTIPQKQSRAIGGLSIGALQSIYISATHPDVFGYIGLFSPMRRPVFRYGDCSSLYKNLKGKHTVQFENPPQLYWVMIGKNDIFYLSTKSYCKYLDKHNYIYERLYSKGGHDWYNWIDYCNMFMERLWKFQETQP